MALATFVAFLGFIGYFALQSDLHVEEAVISKTEDSSHKYESIIVKRNAGATVSTSYSVRIRAAGSDDLGKEVLLVDKVSRPDLLTVSWEDDMLRITLPSQLQTFKRLDSVAVGKSLVKVVFEPR